MNVYMYIYTLLSLYRVPTKVLLSFYPFIRPLKRYYFLEMLDQRSYRVHIVDAAELFQILDQEITKLSEIIKLLHLDLKVLFNYLIKPCVKKSMS